MGKRQPELGGRERFEFRTGIAGFPGWKGMRRQGNPSSIPIWKFWTAENVSLAGDDAYARGGQSRLNSGGALDGCVLGLWDTGGNETGAVGQGALITTWLGPIGDLITFDEETGTFGSIPSDLTISNPAPHSMFLDSVNQEILYGSKFNDADLKTLRMGVGKAPYQFPSMGSAGVTFTSGTNYIANVVRDVAGTMFFGVYSSASGSAGAYRYDGTTVEREDGAGVGDVGCIIIPTDVAGVVYAAYFSHNQAVGPNVIRRRDENGTWSGVTLGGGSGSFHAYSYVRYPGDATGTGAGLYVGGTEGEPCASNADASIYSLSGTTATQVFSESVTGSSEVRCFAMANDSLYFGKGNYQPSLHDQNCTIGKFDGTTWTAIHKNFDAQFGTDFFVNQVVGLARHRGRMYALLQGVADTDGNTNNLVSASLSALSGTWTDHGTVAGSTQAIGAEGTDTGFFMNAVLSLVG